MVHVIVAEVEVILVAVQQLDINGAVVSVVVIGVVVAVVVVEVRVIVAGVAGVAGVSGTAGIAGVVVVDIETGRVVVAGRIGGIAVA